VVAIAAGDFHSLTLRADGTVVGWGYTNYGQARVPDGLSNVVAIAAGDTHSLALKADGTFVGWGNNSYGQTTLPAGLTGAVAIAGGNQYSLVTTPGPGFLAKPPAAVALAPGASTNLSISVWSAGPFTNQWAFDGAPILGESGVDLMITNFDLTKAGAYSIAISNQQGYAIAVSVLRLTNSPVVLVDGVDFGGGTVTGVDVSQISMSSTFGKAGHIYYSLDGSEPDFTAIPYLTPISLSNSATLRGQ
jgi:hypothetical protein